MSSKITPTSGKCSSCSHDGAPKVCSGCNAVLDSSGTSLVPLTRYCNEACQKVHFKSEDEKLAVLTYLGCTDAVNHMYWLLHPMLENICTSIEKVQIHTKPHQRLLIMKRPEGPDRTDVPHDILKATLKNGEIYALDIAGAQHGHYDSVTPWVKYERLRIQKLGESQEWQPIVAKPKVVYPELSWPDDAPFLQVFIDLVKEWQERNGRLVNMLKMPGRPFRETQDELIRFLDGKLRDFRPRALEEEKRIRAEREKA